MGTEGQSSFPLYTEGWKPIFWRIAEQVGEHSLMAQQHRFDVGELLLISEKACHFSRLLSAIRGIAERQSGLSLN
jgi:hypothetical protein